MLSIVGNIFMVFHDTINLLWKDIIRDRAAAVKKTLLVAWQISALI